MTKNRAKPSQPQDVRNSIKLNTPLLPILVSLLLVIQLVSPSQSWMMLFVGFGCVWVIAYVWSRSLLRNVELVREMRMGWVQVGDRLEERFTLFNKGWAPGMWMELVDHSTLPGHVGSRVTGVDSFSDNSWSVKSICSRRGAFTLGPTTLLTGDPFGVYTVALDYPSSATMMVMPPIVPLPTIEVASGGRAGEGRRRTATLERTISAAGVRSYMRGDSLSWVHWKTSAHRDDLFVRLFENAPSSDWWLVLDLDSAVQVGRGEDSTIEHGIVLTASLLDRGLRLRRAVGLFAYGKDLIWFEPREGEAQRWEVLRALALATPGEQPLEQILPLVKPSIGGASSLIVITPSLKGEWIKSLLSLRRRGVVPTVLLLDASSFGGEGRANAAAATLVDLEIAHHVISKEALDVPEMRPGRGQHHWQISPQGRAILKNKSQDMTWRRL